ncbi:MAG: PepSY domain-containing protein [Thiogranum sp.]|nr:PepSY domain-containing protein [Thiogranum sp.]
MDTRAVIFSAVAVLGTTGLLWTGFNAAGNAQREHEDHDHEHRYEARDAQRYSSDEQEQVRMLQQQGDILSLEQILERARSHRQGRVLEAELERKRDRYIYEIELVDDGGQVWEMKLDAMSGELLKQEREN